MKQIIKHKKKLLAGIAIGLILVAVLAVLFFFNKNRPTQKTNADSADNNPALITFGQLPKDSHILSVLLLGYGGAGHEGGFLTDAIQVFYADFDKGKIALISIPRDLWIKIPENGETKINAVWFNNANKNQAANTKALVSQIINLPISYFIAVDFVGFQKAIGENLQGIEVDVAETLDDPWYPIKGEEQNLCGKTPEEVTELTKKLTGFELERQFPCRYEHLIFQKGINTMQGGEALKYVRSRHGSGDGDIARGRRQQEVLLGASKKLFSLNTLVDIPAFFKAVSKNIQTDISPDILQFFVPLIKNAADLKIININLSTTNVLTTGTSADRQAIILPKDGNFNWTGIQKFIGAELNKN